jgi:hypothetical protein
MVGFSSAYKFVLVNWNKLLAFISLFGILVFNFIPNATEYYKLFIFLAANAVVWTLIDVNNKLDRKPKNDEKSYKNLREAKQDIIQTIKLKLRENKNQLSIRIIAGRMKTISDFMRELKDDINEDRIICKNTTIIIYGISPSFFKNWKFTDLSKDINIKNKFIEYSKIIPILREEIMGYNNLDKFKSNDINFQYYYYNFVPHYYAFIIGDDSLFYGFFTWNRKLNDFSGPDNKCFYLDKSMDNFKFYLDYFQNRIEFIEDTKINN